MPYFETKDAHKIYYERPGNCGPVVILLHGLASSTQIWARQVRALQKTCQVTALDFPGHGRSDRQNHYSFQDEAELIKQLMDECGIQKASLIAISMGCSAALIFAIQHPDRVDKLILEGPVGGYRFWWTPSGWLDWFVFTLMPLAIQVSIAIFGYSATAHWINTFGVKTKRNFKILDSLQCKADHQAIRDLFWDSTCAPYVVGLLRAITAPVLLIRGQNDPMPKRFVDYIYKYLSDAVYIEVPETQHLVALEKPHYFNSLVLNFLNLKNKNLIVPKKCVDAI